jgi:hypothetical protein
MVFELAFNLVFGAAVINMFVYSHAICGAPQSEYGQHGGAPPVGIRLPMCTRRSQYMALQGPVIVGFRGDSGGAYERILGAKPLISSPIYLAWIFHRFPST